MRSVRSPNRWPGTASTTARSDPDGVPGVEIRQGWCRRRQTGPTQVPDNDTVTLMDRVLRLAAVQAQLPPPFGPQKLPPPASSDEALDDLPVGYAELLRIADGAVCGSTG